MQAFSYRVLRRGHYSVASGRDGQVVYGYFIDNPVMTTYSMVLIRLRDESSNGAWVLLRGR